MLCNMPQFWHSMPDPSKTLISKLIAQTTIVYEVHELHHHEHRSTHQHPANTKPSRERREAPG